MFGHAAEPGSIRMSVVDQGLQPYAFAAGRAGLITVTLLVAKVQARAFQLGFPAVTKDSATRRKEAPRACRSPMLASALSVIASTDFEILHFTAGL
jgi:hypothetical protein